MMLSLDDLAQLRIGEKRAGYLPEPQPTLGDLFMAIRADQGLDFSERARLIEQLRQRTGYASDATPLSTLLHGVFGGIIGSLISKYFGMGPVGQAFSAFAGFGLGSSLRQSRSGWMEL